MANNVKNINKEKISATNLIYLIGMIIITIIFLVIMFFIIVRPGVINDFNDLEHIRLSEYNTLGSSEESEYLIFVYSSKKNKNYPYSVYRNDLVKETVISYANYVKENGGKKIYCLDISKDENKEAITKLNLSDAANVPAVTVMKFANNTSTISTSKKTTADIISYLEGLMK